MEALTATNGSLYFVIVRHFTGCFYLGVFEDEAGWPEHCIGQYREDSVDTAQSTAFTEYGVPRDAWAKIELRMQ